MPPRTRTTKALKENIVVGDKNKRKPINSVTKTTRKALADKTNSLSDDNASIEVPTKVKKILQKAEVTTTDCDNKRPRRNRRVPTRYVENHVFNTLSISKDSPVKGASNTGTPQTTSTKTSPLKTPSKDLEDSLVNKRPRRICRLPPKFEEHSVSPIKFIPLQPCNASTPIPQKGSKTSITGVKSNIKDNVPIKKTTQSIKPSNKKVVSPKLDSSGSKSSPDTNNNSKRRSVRIKKAATKTELLSKKVNLKIKKNDGDTMQKHIHHSFKILEDIKESSDKNTNIDIYEFTYDPNEEPPPQKKKRKRAVRKKPAKPNTVVFKNNYNDNISKALNLIKNKVTKKPENIKIQNKAPQQNTAATVNTSTNKVENSPAVPYTYNSNIVSIHVKNHAPIYVEDHVADFEEIVNNYEEINYTPENSPHPKTPDPQPLNFAKPLNSTRNESPVTVVPSNDPLNLQDDLSFFDSQPVASSSMNVSVRHPLASPWRVEFGNLPIKWQADTYLKPNMTPAVECSFINSDDKKKHVYTNMVPVINDPSPHIVEKTSNLKQTSIIEFMKEAAERSLNKKKRRRSVTPKKVISDFDDIINTSSADFGYKTPKKSRKDNENATCTKNTEKQSDSSNELSSHKESSKNSKKITDDSNIDKVQTRSLQKQKENDCTYFGFDDSENQDQENVSPVKNVNSRVKGLRPRSRAVLQEINAQSGPTRAMVPIAAKSKVATSSEAVNKVYEVLKSAEDAPLFPEKNVVRNIGNTNVCNLSTNSVIDNEDSQSVHLFEDIEIVHHLKPYRKSYGKAKKVTFQQRSDSDSETNDGDRLNQPKSSDEDDLSDPSFKMPTIKPSRTIKKRTTKKQKSKKSRKEEKEVEAWAAGFNSMCEDIEEFTLLVE